MNKTVPKRCPFCKTINQVDIAEELKRHKRPVYKIFHKEPQIATPKEIAIICSNCGKSFKIKVG